MNKKIAYAAGGMGDIGTAVCRRLAKDRRRLCHELATPGQMAGSAETDIG